MDIKGYISRVVDAREGEARSLLLAFIFFFLLLTSYYILRPIRDEMGIAGGVDKLAWLFTGTAVAMLLINPLFAALVVKLPRRLFISVSYRFFIANLVIFFLLLHTLKGTQNVWVGRVFFIWISVFNLFVVSVFWAFLADIFTLEQGKRLFGFISVGGTLGGILGAGITSVLAERLGPVNLLLVSAFLLEVCVYCLRRFPITAKPQPTAAEVATAEQPIGGNLVAGIVHVARSPYLMGICLYMLFFTITSTFVYFQQSDIIGRSISDRAARTALLARLDMIINLLTMVTQIFFTSRIIRVLGIGVTLAILPIFSVIGFGTLSLMPTLALIVSFQVLRRAGNFAVAKPTREVLFTVVSKEDKYKAKSFIDTFVYRIGDQMGAWIYKPLLSFGLTLGQIAMVAVPFSLVWLVIGLWLGRAQNVNYRDDENTYLSSEKSYT